MRIPHRYAVALTASLGLFMAVLDNTIVNVALTPMAEAFKTDLNSIQWIVTGYFLAQAAIIPVAGYMSNRFGIKRMFMLSLAFFTIGSFFCALATDENMLIIFRVLQGLGGGSLFPLANAITFTAFSMKDRAAASAVVGIPVLLAPAFGPTIGGLLTDKFGWEYIFLINVPFGMISLFLAWRIFDKDKLPEKHKQARFDYIGLVLIAIGTVTIVYAFSLVSQTRDGSITAANPRGDINGWGYWLFWVLSGVSLLLLALFALYELKFSKDPVLDLTVLKNYNFAVASMVTWAIAALVFGSLLLFPIFLEQVRLPNLGALDAGLALMPQGLAAAVAVGFGGKLYLKIGVRAMVITGGVLLVISSWMLSSLTVTSDGGTMMPWLIIRGFGFGLAMIPVQTLALQSFRGPALAKASSLFNVTRQIASSIGVAVLITLFSQQATSHANELAKQAMDSVPAGTVIDPNSPAYAALKQKLAAEAGTMGINDVLSLVAIGCIGFIVLGIALPGRKKALAAGNPEPAMVME